MSEAPNWLDRSRKSTALSAFVHWRYRARSAIVVVSTTAPVAEEDDESVVEGSGIWMKSQVVTARTAVEDHMEDSWARMPASRTTDVQRKIIEAAADLTSAVSAGRESR
jgi:hypothetical protein